MEYIVEIQETLQRQVIVKANSKSEAVAEVRNKYKECEIVLSDNDFTGVEFVVHDKGTSR